MKYVILIYNPSSGLGSIAEQLDYIIARYAKGGYILTPLRISRDKNFYSSMLLPTIDTLRPHHILIAGGDGTINRYMNFAASNGIKTPIALLPVGTANDFARMLGISTSMKRCIDQILSGEIHNIDLGKVNDRYFINILSGGLMTDVSQKTPTALKNIFGRVAYFFSVMGELPTFRRMNIHISSPDVEYHGDCLLFMVFNGRTAGTLPVAKNAALDDGLLEVIIIKGDNIAVTIGDLFHILLQKNGKYPDDIVYFQTPRLDIRCDERGAPTDVDGEQGTSFPMHIECLSGGMQIIF